MRLLSLAAAGIACLAAAAALPATLPPGSAGDAALSLGGLRVVLVDALFLRAEALRRQGLVDEVPALYRRILEIDPGSETAIDFLADAEVHDLLSLAPTPAGRVAWWTDAYGLVEEGLRRNPGSARLEWRMADLLLYVPEQHPEVASHLDAAGRDRLYEALLHLARSARLSESLPRLGFAHLLGLVRLAPRLAALRLAAGAGRAKVDEVLALGWEALRLREAALASFVLDPDAEKPVPASLALTAGLRLVGRVRDDLDASPARTAEARTLLDDYVSILGRDAVALALEPLLRR